MKLIERIIDKIALRFWSKERWAKRMAMKMDRAVRSDNESLQSI